MGGREFRTACQTVGTFLSWGRPFHPEVIYGFQLLVYQTNQVVPIIWLQGTSIALVCHLADLIARVVESPIGVIVEYRMVLHVWPAKAVRLLEECPNQLQKNFPLLAALFWWDSHLDKAEAVNPAEDFTGGDQHDTRRTKFVLERWSHSETIRKDHVFHSQGNATIFYQQPFVASLAKTLSRRLTAFVNREFQFV